MISFKSDWQLELTTERILLLADTGWRRSAGYFWDLDRTSLWLDEAASSVHQSHRGFLDMLAHTARDNYPPLHNVILWTTVVKLFGFSETAVRFPSAVMAVDGGLCDLPARQVRLECCTEGLIAALLLALLPIRYLSGTPGEARMYPLLCLDRHWLPVGDRGALQAQAPDAAP